MDPENTASSEQQGGEEASMSIGRSVRASAALVQPSSIGLPTTNSGSNTKKSSKYENRSTSGYQGSSSRSGGIEIQVVHTNVRTDHFEPEQFEF